MDTRFCRINTLYCVRQLTERGGPYYNIIKLNKRSVPLPRQRVKGKQVKGLCDLVTVSGLKPSCKCSHCESGKATAFFTASQETCRLERYGKRNFPDHEDLIVP